jgi:hypothetical protein
MNGPEVIVLVGVLLVAGGALAKLRDQRRIDDIVLRGIQGRLDREEVRLADSALEDD